MSRHQPGDFILLWWDEEAPEMHVHGHVDHAAFVAIIEREHPKIGRVPTVGASRHAWGGWRLDGQDEYGNAKSILRVYSTPGRGRFPLTYTDSVTWRTVTRADVETISTPEPT